MKIKAAHLLRGPNYVLESGPFQIETDGAHIAKVDRIGDSPPSIAMPALVNAHDHGYGVPTLAVGAPDDALECWIPGLANRPDSDPELEASVAFGRMALGGIGTTVHFHNSLRRDRLQDEAEAVARAAETVGIRVAFACPIGDQNPIVYGDHTKLAACDYPPEFLSGPGKDFPSGSEQVANALALNNALGSALFNVQLGPIGPQWCSDETLAHVASVSAESGMRVHMHLLETERQRQWLDKTYQSRPVQWLDEIGLLSPRLTVAHGVWLRSDECELLADRGVTIAVNSSSNLRLRSGFAPVSRFREAGVSFAVGLDGSGLDDDQDMLRELRLFKSLQSGMGLVDQMPASDVLKSAFGAGYRAFDGQQDYGLLEPGSLADMMTLDTGRITADAIDPQSNMRDLVFSRANSTDIRSLIVAGRSVVIDGSLVAFDFADTMRELAAAARRSKGNKTVNKSNLSARREAIRRYYRDEHHLD